MATEKLIVKNFGPIREADLDLKKVTVFIGEQASGKSVLAKLSTIFRSNTSPQGTPDYEFEDYIINNFFTNSTYFSYENKQFRNIWSYKKSKVSFFNKDLENRIEKLTNARERYLELGTISKEKNDSTEKESIRQQRSIWNDVIRKTLKELIDNFPEVLYIPAERFLVSFFESSVELKRRNKYSIDAIQLFADKYNEYKKDLLKLKILQKGIYFQSLDNNDLITLENGHSISLVESSSGLQSLVPLQVTIEGSLTNNSTISFTIEEPELNLYPNTQKELVKYLIEKCTQGDNRLIITTHSPYILTALNNLIQAKNVVNKNPDMASEVNAIVPPQYQIDFEDVAAYFVADGTARSIMNADNQLIDANALDEVSNDINEEFSKLVQLEYQNEVL